MTHPFIKAVKKMKRNPRRWTGDSIIDFSGVPLIAITEQDNGEKDAYYLLDESHRMLFRNNRWWDDYKKPNAELFTLMKVHSVNDEIKYMVRVSIFGVHSFMDGKRIIGHIKSGLVMNAVIRHLAHKFSKIYFSIKIEYAKKAREIFKSAVKEFHEGRWPVEEIIFSLSQKDISSDYAPPNAVIRANPEFSVNTRLFHGSPVSGIKTFDLSKKRTEEIFLTEGKGIYLTSHFDTAKAYGPYVYEVKINGPIFDATKFENLRKILVLVNQETDVDLTKHKLILASLKEMVDGRYSILSNTGIVWQIKLILDNDENFVNEPETVEKIVGVVEGAVNEVRAMKYYDPKISDSALWIVRDPSMVEIISETKTNPMHKVGGTEIYTSFDGEKSFHLNKIGRTYVVSWEPHEYNAKKFSKRSEALTFISSKIKIRKRNPSKLKQVHPNHYQGVIANHPILVAHDESRDCWIVRCGKKGQKYLHKTADSLHEAKEMVEEWLKRASLPAMIANPDSKKTISDKDMDELILKIKKMQEEGYKLDHRYFNKHEKTYCAVMIKVKQNPDDNFDDEIAEDVMRFHEAGEAITAISRKLRTSPLTIKRILAKLGVDVEAKQEADKAKRYTKKSNPEDDQEAIEEGVIELYRSGRKVEDVSRKTGVTINDVKEILARRGVTRMKGGHDKHDITADDILVKIKAGKTPKEIADAAKISVERIYSRLKKAGYSYKEMKKKKSGR